MHIVTNDRISFFYRLNNITLCVCVCVHHITSSVSIPLLTHCFHVLAMMDTLQWTWKCKYLFEVLISFPLDIHSEVILLYYMVVLFLIFLRTLHNVFHSGSTNLHSQKWYTRVPFFPHRLQYLSLVFLIRAILTDVRWYLIVILIYIYLMISGVEHLFSYLLDVCILWGSKSIWTSASCPRPWESWTPSSTTFLSTSLVRHHAWRITTSAQLSHPGRSRPLCACCYLGSWPSMPCLRALRLSPSIPALSKYNMPSHC